MESRGGRRPYLEGCVKRRGGGDHLGFSVGAKKKSSGIPLGNEKSRTERGGGPRAYTCRGRERKRSSEGALERKDLVRGGRKGGKWQPLGAHYENMK